MSNLRETIRNDFDAAAKKVGFINYFQFWIEDISQFKLPTDRPILMLLPFEQPLNVNDVSEFDIEMVFTAFGNYKRTGNETTTTIQEEWDTLITLLTDFLKEIAILEYIGIKENPTAEVFPENKTNQNDIAVDLPVTLTIYCK